MAAGAREGGLSRDGFTGSARSQASGCRRERYSLAPHFAASAVDPSWVLGSERRRRCSTHPNLSSGAQVVGGWGGRVQLVVAVGVFPGEVGQCIVARAGVYDAYHRPGAGSRSRAFQLVGGAGAGRVVSVL